MSGIHAAMFYYGPMYDYTNGVLNGTFVDASEWTQSFSDWTLGGGVATCVADGSTNIRQPTLFAGATYFRIRVAYRLVSITGPGYVYPTVDTSSGNGSGVQRSVPGYYDEHIELAGGTITQLRFNFGGGGGTGGSITDVRMYAYTPA